MNLENYLLKYGNNYPKELLEYIIKNYDKDTDKELPDPMNQIYDATGVFSDKENPYLQYLKLIKDYFDIRGNILEIGGGFYPSLASHIANEQIRLKSGTITVYDKNLVTTSLKNIKLIKRDFTTEDDISNFDLLVGIMPCQATSLIVRKANEFQKDFFIALCGCTHFSREYLRFEEPTLEAWFEYIRNIYYKTNVDGVDLVEITSPTKYNKYPILIKKRKNNMYKN